MRKVKCGNGHYYDGDRFTSCPLCGSPRGNGPEWTSGAPPLDQEPTVSAYDGGLPAPEGEPTEGRRAAGPIGTTQPDREDADTLRGNRRARPGQLPPLPVAWLICVRGPCLGRSFPCAAGRSRIGRGTGLEVDLDRDLSVPGEAAGEVVYEPRRRLFTVTAVPGRGPFCRNGRPVAVPELLRPYDHISLGRTDLVFLPLCGEHFSWDEYISGGQQL